MSRDHGVLRINWWDLCTSHYTDVIMGTMASQITSGTIVYSTVYSGADRRKHQSSASLAFVWVIHRWPVNSPHKWPVTRKMFPFDDVIKCSQCVDGVVPRRHNLTITKKPASKMTQAALVWKMKVFVIRLPYFFKIHRTNLEILYKKVNIIKYLNATKRYTGWQRSKQTFINILQKRITSWITAI